MKFTDLAVDGFGVWTGLELRELSPGLNVLYGPNEAGKTTLLEFVRAMLYGFTPARARSLSAAGAWRAGGRPAGNCHRRTPRCKFAAANMTICRLEMSPSPRPTGPCKASPNCEPCWETSTKRFSSACSPSGWMKFNSWGLSTAPLPPGCSTIFRPDWIAFRWPT